jgi:Family of unknown function (DUF5985)
MSLNLVVTLGTMLLSLACAVLLSYSYATRGARLLLWCALFFVCLTLNNVLLFFNLVVVPYLDLRLYQFASAAAGLLFVLYGLIYEAQ